MTFNFQMLKYDLSDLIDESNEDKLINRYRTYIKQLSQEQLASLFENLSKLSPEQLMTLKLVYTRRTYDRYPTLFVLKTMSYNHYYIVYKDDDCNPPMYYPATYTGNR